MRTIIIIILSLLLNALFFSYTTFKILPSHLRLLIVISFLLLIFICKLSMPTALF